MFTKIFSCICQNLTFVLDSGKNLLMYLTFLAWCDSFHVLLNKSKILTIEHSVTPSNWSVGSPIYVNYYFLSEELQTATAAYNSGWMLSPHYFFKASWPYKYYTAVKIYTYMFFGHFARTALRHLNQLALEGLYILALKVTLWSDTQLGRAWCAKAQILSWD